MKGDENLVKADYQSAARCHLAPHAAFQPGRGFRPCSRLSGRLSELWPFVRQAIVPAGGLSGRRFRYATNFSGFAADAYEHEAGGISANCVSGLLDGGLKGRLLGFGHLSHEVENPGGAGIQPAAGFSPPSWYATNFSSFVSLKCCAAKPEKIVTIPRKPAKSRLQPERPPHERPKPKRRPERPPAGTIACHTRRSPACHERPKPRQSPFRRLFEPGPAGRIALAVPRTLVSAAPRL